MPRSLKKGPFIDGHLLKKVDASMANRVEAVKMLAKPNYVGADEAVIGNSMTGTFEYEKGQDLSPLVLIIVLQLVLMVPIAWVEMQVAKLF